MKDAVRAEIDEVIKQLNFDKEQFKEVGKNLWEGIIKNIENTFVNWKGHSSFWYWEYFNDGFSIDYPNNDAYKDLSKLIDDTEKVWFLAQEDRGNPKFWLFEGQIKPIQTVLENSSMFEYYIVSKKYLWLLCENHHGYLIGTGEQMIEKLKKLSKQVNR